MPSQRTIGCGPFDDTGRPLGRAPWCLDGACGAPPVDGLLLGIKLLPVPTPILEVRAPDRGLATAGDSLMLRCCDEAHLKRLGTTRAPVPADCHGLWSCVRRDAQQHMRVRRNRNGGMKSVDQNKLNKRSSISPDDLKADLQYSTPDTAV